MKPQVIFCRDWIFFFHYSIKFVSELRNWALVEKILTNERCKHFLSVLVHLATTETCNGRLKLATKMCLKEQRLKGALQFSLKNYESYDRINKYYNTKNWHFIRAVLEKNTYNLKISTISIISISSINEYLLSFDQIRKIFARIFFN